jgi:hypothetical protein
MTEQPCVEQARLSDIVAKAVRAVNSVKLEQTQAWKEKRDTVPFAAVLAQARIAERRAVAALDQHKKEHGC